MMDDLSRALSRDLDGTFADLVKSFGPRLYWGLRRICGDHQEAEDLTQETFIRTYKALTDYEGSRIEALDLGPWIWTIALNLGRNHLRDRSRRPRFVPEQDAYADDPIPVDAQAWDRRLGQLNRPQRTAVVLRHVAGMGIGEISAATGRPEGTVKADIHRGLERLKRIMEDEE